MKKHKLLAAFAAMAPGAVLAEGASTVDTTAVSTAITSLEGAATSYAGIILPYIANVGLAFIGIAVMYLLFKVFKRFVSGK